MQNENPISRTNNTLLVLGELESPHGERVTQHFCGTVTRDPTRLTNMTGERLTICGDLGSLGTVPAGARVIRELSRNVPDLEGSGAESIEVGQVPLLVHGVGVLYPRFFAEEDLFRRIQSEHQFQNLTESTKGSKALRTGIYLTDVAREASPEGERLHFRLLRCSSNLTGPTDNLRATDRMIMDRLNAAARDVFERETSLNHVLAQIYTNTRDTEGRRRERKAKISAHSDKTKDMRDDGLIAFCTFYDTEELQRLTRSSADPYDWCHGKTSGLTQLVFRRKPAVSDPKLVEEFTVTLYPNSLFIIPLSTNRLYTHAIRPSRLNVEQIPTRMGYVARSSKAEALFADGHTYLKQGDALIRLEPMTRETLASLRSTYREENITADMVRYGKVHFSMNAGDYQKPIL